MVNLRGTFGFAPQVPFVFYTSSIFVSGVLCCLEERCSCG